jgi:hypothetical protein
MCVIEENLFEQKVNFYQQYISLNVKFNTYMLVPSWFVHDGVYKFYVNACDHDRDQHVMKEPQTLYIFRYICSIRKPKLVFAGTSIIEKPHFKVLKA